MPEVLYVHPRGHPSDLVVPAGALSSMNAVDCQKLGRYADEVTDAELRSARIVAMDLHWAFGFAGFGALLHKVREVNPQVTVVVGGITAGHYPEELLLRYPIDYVIRGDAEVAFGKLVHAVLHGSSVEFANVWQRREPAPATRRLSQQEFDATDSIGALWFPSYVQRSRWDSSAFSLGRTLSAARGCPMRCPTCYGSYASTFGESWLWRSTESAVAAVQRAANDGTEHFRIVVGKPGRRRVDELLLAIANQAPYGFKSQVGVFSCTPPSAELAEPLAAAFPSGIVISTTHPSDQVPALEHDAAEDEWRRWLSFSEATERCKNNGVEVWVLRDESLRSATRAVAPAAKTHVTHAGAWEVARPMDGRAPADFHLVRDAVQTHWTFLVARLSSPSLARVLAPYAWLDDIEPSPDTRPHAGPLEAARRIASGGWRAHRVPSFPDLKLWCATVPKSALSHSAERAHASAAYGDCRFGWLGTGSWDFNFVEMQVEQRHDAVYLHAETGPGEILLLVPCPSGAASLSAEWLSGVAAGGLLTLEIPAASRGPLRTEVRLALNALTLTATCDGVEVASGRSDPGFYRPRRG